MTKRSNGAQGAAFEQMVAEEFEKFAPDLTVKRIDRSSGLRYESIYDLELLDFPDIKLDCKSTVGQFSFNDLRKLLKQCQKKYCLGQDIPIIVFGERRGKSRINRDNIGVAMLQGTGILILPLETWLNVLNLGDNWQHVLLLTQSRVCGN